MRNVSSLGGYTTNLGQTAGLLGASVGDILGAITQAAAGTAEMAASINETTTTVESMRQQSQLAAQKAQYVSDSAQRALQVSQNGQKAVEETATVMDRIREQMETITQTVVRLSEQSQSIGGIIASVTDLADQSNLLAVNAAIEAAKAGEQGKGFSVVAQEIKSLAEQSKQATAQVRGILSDVQKATSSAVMATEQGSKAVEAGVKQATQAGEANRALTETSGVALQAAIQIAASNQQQVVGMDQIGMAMISINQAGSQNAGSLKQMEIAARKLHELGQSLTGLVLKFKA
jgi:methyl-accepting chemotaxis protein